jgi:hypothetical protein
VIVAVGEKYVPFALAITMSIVSRAPNPSTVPCAVEATVYALLPVWSTTFVYVSNFTAGSA